MEDVGALFLGFNPILLSSAVDSFLKTIPPDLRVQPVVIDNFEGGCAQWAREKGLAWLRLPQVSYAQAYNEAVRRLPDAGVDATWLLLCNDDLVFASGAFWEGLVRLTDDGNEIVGQKLVYPQGRRPNERADPQKLYVQHCGIFFTRDYWPFHVARWQTLDVPLASRDLYPPAVTFACVLLKRDMWEALGGLDEQYWFGFEDIDFCLRAKENGAAVACSNASGAVTHLESQSTGQDAANKERQWAKFQAKFVQTNRIAEILGVWPIWRS